MNSLKNRKLNTMLSQWPVGILLTSKWLNEHGYYKQLVKLYCDQGWLKSVGKGAYSRLNDEITWQGAVKALQSQLMRAVHVGGLTALQFYGVAQYVNLNEHNPVFYLYNSSNIKVNLPQWFQRYFTNCHVEQKKLFEDETSLSYKAINNVEIKISSPERAMLEVLALVPHKITLSHANELIESLDRLRSDVMQQLLESCCSIKVKRLFLYLADKNNLSCFNDLKLEHISLGSGNRVIGEGGQYHAKWLLSIPKENEINNERDDYVE